MRKVNAFMVAAVATALMMIGATVHVQSAGAMTRTTCMAEGFSTPCVASDDNPSCGYTVTEDSDGPYPCGWDCGTMGNGLCGPWAVRAVRPV